MRRMRYALLFLATFSVLAQQSPELKNAQSLFAAQKWSEAAAAYEAIVKTDKTDPRPRAGLAAALYNLGELDKALPIALEANRLLDVNAQLQYPGLPPGAVMLRIARIYNRLGQTNEAFQWLEKAQNYPLPNVQAVLETEPDMANLRADGRWKKFADTVRSNIDPCGTRAEFRQLDFWLGDWDVLGGAGQKVGSSHIEKILGKCVIFETYTAEPGTSLQASYVGQAFHFFDTNANKWVQHYVDTTATPFDWIGEFANGAMRYTREGPFGPSNSPIKQRMTFTQLPDGKVRQLFEQSVDGKTWRAGFDGTYVKRGVS